MASVKTAKGREKLAKALTGDKVLPKITKIVFGSGGTNSNGSPKTLSGNEIALFSKVIEKNVSKSYPVTTTARFSASLNADLDNLIGVNINEAGLVDEEGDIVALKTFTNKGMDSGTIIEFDYDAEF